MIQVINQNNKPCTSNASPNRGNTSPGVSVKEDKMLVKLYIGYYEIHVTTKDLNMTLDSEQELDRVEHYCEENFPSATIVYDRDLKEQVQEAYPWFDWFDGNEPVQFADM